MTLTMLDSITVANLPAGADAYLGYVDGHWPTFASLASRFPRAHLLSMAVFASDDAEGCDCEAGDLTPSQVPAWVTRQRSRGISRPVVYVSASSVTSVLGALGGDRQGIRLLTAHYTHEPHICGPATCAYPGVPAADGTQWTDTAPGANGTQVDESLLLANFFGTPPVTAPPSPQAAAKLREASMILVQVNRAEVPAGVTWPGIFLLDAAGLHHVATAPDVTAYMSVGINAPVTISWAEYLARGGNPAA
jgi:hypothetical protein